MKIQKTKRVVIKFHWVDHVAASERTFQRKINKVMIIKLCKLKWDIKNDYVKKSMIEKILI